MPNSSQILHWIVITMLAFAVVMISSSATTMPDHKKTDVSEVMAGAEGGVVQGEDQVRTTPLTEMISPIISTEILYALVAIIVMFLFTYGMKVDWLYRNGSVFNPITLILLIAIGCCGYLLMPGRGHTMNESTRWIRITSSFGFQPSEIAKWAMVGIVAWWGARMAGNIRHFWRGFLPVVSSSI